MNDIISPSKSPRKPTPEMIFILALIDPKTQEPRFITKTDNPERYYQRLFRRKGEGGSSSPWIEDLKQQGLKPTYEILEEVPYSSQSRRLRYWIDFYQSQGILLLNGSKVPPATVFIYALEDPRIEDEFEKVFYVGKTAFPQIRLRGHLSLHKCRNEGLLNRLKDLAEYEIKPCMHELEEVPYAQWEEKECFYIDFYREHGAPLTNIREGGQHAATASSTKEKLAEINLGKQHTPESLAKMQAIADTRKGVRRPAEVGAKISKTKTGQKREPFSEEWKRNLGDSRRGKKRSPKTGKKISLALKQYHAMKKSPPSDAPDLWDQDTNNR